VEISFAVPCWVLKSRASMSFWTRDYYGCLKPKIEEEKNKYLVKSGLERMVFYPYIAISELQYWNVINALQYCTVSNILQFCTVIKILQYFCVSTLQYSTVITLHYITVQYCNHNIKSPVWNCNLLSFIHNNFDNREIISLL